MEKSFTEIVANHRDYENLYPNHRSLQNSKHLANIKRLRGKERTFAEVSTIGILGLHC